MGTRTVGYKQGVGRKIAEREVQGSGKNDREKKGGGGRGAGQRAGERKNHCCGAAEGNGERKRARGSRAEKRREKISDGEQGRALGRGK